MREARQFWDVLKTGVGLRENWWKVCFHLKRTFNSLENAEIEGQLTAKSGRRSDHRNINQ
jgi:hypothetical protein